MGIPTGYLYKKNIKIANVKPRLKHVIYMLTLPDDVLSCCEKSLYDIRICDEIKDDVVPYIRYEDTNLSKYKLSCELDFSVDYNIFLSVLYGNPDAGDGAVEVKNELPEGKWRLSTDTQPIPNYDCILNFTFNEHISNIASIGVREEGVWTGTGQYDTGKFGKALSFDGTNGVLIDRSKYQNVSLANGETYSPIPVLCLSFWVKQPEIQNDQKRVLLGNYMASDNSVNFEFCQSDGTDKSVLLVYDTSGQLNRYVFSSVLDDNNWHNIIFNYKQGSNILDIYVDGQLETSLSGKFKFDLTQKITLGQHYDGTQFVPSAMSGTLIDQLYGFKQYIKDKDINSVYELQGSELEMDFPTSPVISTSGAPSDFMDKLQQPFGDGSCVIYYPLDGDLNDGINGQTGSVDSGSPQYGSGIINQGLLIDSSSPTITLPLHPDASHEYGIGNGSLCFWFRFKDCVVRGYSNGTRDMLFKILNSSGSETFHFELEYKAPVSGDTSIVEFAGYLYDNANNKVWIELPVDDKWHHIILTQSKVYLDGKLVSSEYFGNSSLWEMVLQNDGTDFIIDNIRVFSKKLDENEANQLYVLEKGIYEVEITDNKSKIQGTVPDYADTGNELDVFILDGIHGRLLKRTFYYPNTDKKWIANVYINDFQHVTILYRDTVTGQVFPDIEFSQPLI